MNLKAIVRPIGENTTRIHLFVLMDATYVDIGTLHVPNDIAEKAIATLEGLNATITKAGGDQLPLNNED